MWSTSVSSLCLANQKSSWVAHVRNSRILRSSCPAGLRTAVMSTMTPAYPSLCICMCRIETIHTCIYKYVYIYIHACLLVCVFAHTYKYADVQSSCQGHLGAHLVPGKPFSCSTAVFAFILKTASCLAHRSGRSCGTPRLPDPGSYTKTTYHPQAFYRRPIMPAPRMHQNPGPNSAKRNADSLFLGPRLVFASVHPCCYFGDASSMVQNCIPQTATRTPHLEPCIPHVIWAVETLQSSMCTMHQTSKILQHL